MAKHIGIVGCSAPGAALCYQTICSEGAAIMGPHAHPEVSMHTHPLSEYMNFIYGDMWEGVVNLMLSSARKLESAGADFLICPDNTIHEVFEDVAEKSSLPWLHIAREVVKEAVLRGFGRPAVLGTRYLMTGSVYAEACKLYDLNPAVPAATDMERVNRIIFSELVYAEIMEESKKYILDLIRMLSENGCDCVVLGCTELPLIVSQEESPLPVLDSTRILSRAALKHAVED